MLNKLSNFMIVGLATILAATTFMMAWVMYSPLPWWDYWNVVLLRENLGELFRLHNEHLISIPRIFYAADTYLVKGTGVLAMGFMWLFQILVFALVAYVVSYGKPSGRKYAAVGVAAAFFFAGRNLENLGWQFQVGFVGLAFVSALAIALTARGLVDRRFAWAGAALALTAPFWSAQGLLVPLICGAIALVFGLGRALVIANGSAFFACGAFYYFIQKTTGQVMAMGAPVEAINVVKTFVKQIGYVPAHIVTFGLTPPFALMLCGFVLALIVVAAQALSLWRGRHRKDTVFIAQVATLSLAILGLGAATLISIGRSSEAITMEPAYRYFIFSGFLWVPVICIMLEKVERFAKSLCIVLLLCMLAQQQWYYTFSTTWGKMRASAAESILADPANLEALRPTYPAPDQLGQRLELMRERHLSIFADR